MVRTLCILRRFDFIGLGHLSQNALMETIQYRSGGKASVNNTGVAKGALYILASVAVCFRRSLTR